MNRREAIKTAVSAAAGSALLRPTRFQAQEPAATDSAIIGNTIYVNAASGADNNSGAKENPLRTLAEAARRVNQSSGTGPVTILLAEGVYAVSETTLLKPERRAFTKMDRLTIRAEVFPDDPEWNTGRMPTLIHTLPVLSTWNGRPDPLGGAADGMLIETSHVTIQGLKFLGVPVIETPKPGLKRRLYAISRLRKDLEDLEVAQCLFLGDKAIAPLHVPIIAMGNGVVVHHCVFWGFTADAVVYWTASSTGHAMMNCIFHGMYGGTVWTTSIASDFEYRNNVVDGANYVWIYQGGASAQADATGGQARLPDSSGGKGEERNRYKVVNSLFANNRRLAGAGTGARIEFMDIDPSFLEMEGTQVTEQPIAFEHDTTKRNYLHPVAGSDAAKNGAGLFLTLAM